MASVIFYLQSKNDNATVYVKFTENRNNIIRLKTKEVVKRIYWDKKKGEVKDLNKMSIHRSVKQHHIKVGESLRGLYDRIIKAYNANPLTVDKYWLQKLIDVHYNGGKEINEFDYILEYLSHYKENILPFRTHNRKRIGKRTIQLYTNIINLLIDFLKSKNYNIKVSDYNKTVSNQFEIYLANKVKLNPNTIGRYVPAVKTILKDAKDLGVEVNAQLNDIKGYGVETATVFLNESELNKIRDLKLLTEYLQITRDWLLIGCHTGQRSSDLFRMSKEMITEIDGHKYLNLKQKKTKKKVTIPLHKEVLQILERYNGDFPPTYTNKLESNTTSFNRALKKLAKIAEINRVDKGRVFDKKLKHYEFGEYPIHEIISSHICRRTFCTQYFEKGLPVQIIMSISGHKTEQEFLKYINKDNSELSKQMFLYWNRWEGENVKQKAHEHFK